MLSPAQAQRHPESAGPLSYYRDEAGTEIIPPWQLRPPFLRGARDRYERGRDRLFLATPDGVDYLNYATDHYMIWPWGRPLSQGTGRPRLPMQWDRAGNFIGGQAQRVFSWEERRTGNEGGGTSYIDHVRLRRPNRLHIGHYTYKGLHWTATAGDEVRSHFTPLTYNQLRPSLARLDFDHDGKSLATILFTRGQEGGWFSNWATRVGDTYQESPVVTYGAHLQHSFGYYARVGATFLNQLQLYPGTTRSDAYRGDLPYEMLPPSVIRVYVVDDSPDETQANGIVYDMDIVLEGERQGEAVRLTSISGDPDYDRRLVARPTGGAPVAGNGREAIGTDAVVYEFAMPADVTPRSVRFSAEVADDYRIGVRQEYSFHKSQKDGSSQLQDGLLWPAEPLGSEGRRAFKWHVDEDEVPFYTVLRAEGADGSGANRKRVTFDYGMPTGQTLASIDWNAKLVGLRWSGEVSHNLQNHQFPNGANRGERTERSALAYWVKVLKDLPGGAEVGFEAYRLDPDYSGGYDSRRGGLPFHLDWQDNPGSAVKTVTQEYSLVEDNDDEDQWPDDDISDQPQGGWPDSEVFPGLDENGDNIPDSDRNMNYIPDWEEPFLMYDADPVEFVYGIDFNNNGVPDYRENDDLADYPYPRDQRGRHLLVRLNRLGDLGQYLSAGYYSNHQIAGPGRAKALYLRYEYAYEKPGRMDAGVNYDIKRVEDDIADHTYFWLVPPHDLSKVNLGDTPPGFEGRQRPANPDLLQMRDSWVNTFYARARMEQIEDLAIENSILVIRNDRAEIELDDGTGLLQAEDTHSRLTLVNKIDYAWRWKGLTLQPKFKHLLHRETLESEDEARNSYSEFIPILRANYDLTTRTRLLAGIQGLPMLPYKHWDRIAEDDTYTQRDMMAMLNVQSEYWGFNTSVFLGYQRQHRMYDRDEALDWKDYRLFMDVIIGY